MIFYISFLPFSQEVDDNIFFVVALNPPPPRLDGQAGVGKILRPYVMADVAVVGTGQCRA